MPPVPAAPGAIKIVNTVQFGSRVFVCIMHAGKGNTTPWTIADCQTAAEAIYPAFTNFVTPMHTSAIYETCEVQDLAEDNSFAVYQPGSPAAGTTTGTAGPIQVCALISWQLGVKYRGGKPRTYLSGQADSAWQNPYELQASYAESLVSLAGDYISALQAITINEANLYPACVAYSRAKEPLTDPLVLPIQGVSVSLRLASQRRRLGKESAYARDI